MIQIDDKLISDRILENYFVCDLKSCKGICCIEGDAGAPLEKTETKKIEKVYNTIKPYLRPEGRKAIEEQGTWIKGDDGDLETPLIKGAECAYVIFDKNGITKCAFEKAFEDGKTDFKKPISCHLYPIRVNKTKAGYLLNYDEWSICKSACALGKKLKVKVYEFLKEPIIRKFGKEFYEDLTNTDKALSKEK